MSTEKKLAIVFTGAFLYGSGVLGLTYAAQCLFNQMGQVAVLNKIKNAIHLRFEVLLIAVARKILIERNVQRSPHVSRRDNNRMWEMAEQLESVERRMKTKYENEQ